MGMMRPNVLLSAGRTFNNRIQTVTDGSTDINQQQQAAGASIEVLTTCTSKSQTKAENVCQIWYMLTGFVQPKICKQIWLLPTEGVEERGPGVCRREIGSKRGTQGDNVRHHGCCCQAYPRQHFTAEYRQPGLSQHAGHSLSCS